jgi:integrase
MTLLAHLNPLSDWAAAPKEYRKYSHSAWTGLGGEDQHVHFFCWLPLDGEAIKSIKTAFNNARERAGIEDYRFHDSRHEFASALAMRGVDLNTIRELLGHKTMQMVMRYSHLTDRHKAAAVALLDRTEDTKTDTADIRKGLG